MNLRWDDCHRRYLVDCDSDDCMDVFREHGLPQVGTPYNGLVVKEMLAERLAPTLFAVTITQVEKA